MSCTVLPKSSRLTIILLGLLQGAFLYLTRDSFERIEVASFQTALLFCNTLLFTLPLMLSLSVISLKDFRLWRGLGIILIMLLIVASWANWSLYDIFGGMRKSGIQFQYYACLSAFVFLTLPWLQAQISQKSWFPDYESLHDNLWLNSLTVVITLILIGLFWGILRLCASLFSLLGIEFFENLFFDSDLFIYLANGFMVGIGILTGRTQTQFIKVGRNVLSVMIKGLLPLLSFIALIFIVTLPFVGLNALTAEWSAAGLLTTMVALLVVFVNAVYQTGLSTPPYPKAIRWLVNASILVLPVYALFALYSMWVRVAQYGWTPERVLATVIICVAVCFACSYAFSVMRSRDSWLQPLSSINRLMSLVMIVLLVLVNSPLLDPYRISISSQLARYQQNLTLSESLDLNAWRFKYGRAGNDALLALKNDPQYVSDALRKAELEQVMARQSVWDNSIDETANAEYAELVAKRVQQGMELAKGTTMPPADFWRVFVSEDNYETRECLKDSTKCMALALDLDADGKDEYMVCNFNDGMTPRCSIFSMLKDRWQRIGSVNLYSSDKSADRFKQIMRQGEIKPKPRVWNDLDLGDERVQIHYSIDEK